MSKFLTGCLPCGFCLCYTVCLGGSIEVSFNWGHNFSSCTSKHNCSWHLREPISRSTELSMTFENQLNPKADEVLNSRIDASISCLIQNNPPIADSSPFFKAVYPQNCRQGAAETAGGVSIPGAFLEGRRHCPLDNILHETFASTSLESNDDLSGWYTHT